MSARTNATTASTTASIATVIDRLRGELDGTVTTPDSPDYDTARQVFSGAIDPRPGVIVRPASASDVQTVVRVARESGVDLAVRSGGHGQVSHGADGGIVLDARGLDSLDIDVEGRTAWAGSGLTAGEYSAKVGEHGLATGFGDTGSVGISGITLGGGVGFLSRKHGLTIDSLLAVEIVTADGQLLTASADSHPDLFWALRGGGGNFGVVTRFQYQLHPLPQFVGGMLLLPATPGVVAGFIAEAEAAPEELTTIANVMPCPPLPFAPAEVHGQIVLMALMAYAGDAAEGERALAPFQALAEPIADMLRPMAYAEMFPPDEGGYHPTAVGRNVFMEKVDAATAESIIARLAESDASVRVAQLRVLGGAVSRVGGDETAYAHRDRRIMVNIAAFYDGPQDRVERGRWVTDFGDALAQGEAAAYVNFVGEEGDSGVQRAYPEKTLGRLRAVKAIYDPENVFCHNQNVAPTDGRG